MIDKNSDEVKVLEAKAGGMLPGMAAVCLFMLVISIVGVVGVLNGQFPGAGARYTVLPICTMVVIGVFGLLRLRRWGWALVTGGTLMLSFGYLYKAKVEHNPSFFVMAALALCFFLYLVRTEVRDRLH